MAYYHFRTATWRSRHHGRLEWQSPVEPQTPEARILHSADMLSAEYGEYKTTPPSLL